MGVEWGCREGRFTHTRGRGAAWDGGQEKKRTRERERVVGRMREAKQKKLTPPRPARTPALAAPSSPSLTMGRLFVESVTGDTSKTYVCKCCLTPLAAVGELVSRVGAVGARATPPRPPRQLAPPAPAAWPRFPPSISGVAGGPREGGAGKRKGRAVPLAGGRHPTKDMPQRASPLPSTTFFAPHPHVSACEAASPSYRQPFPSQTI